MKNNDMSLMTLLRDDPELSRRIKEVAKEIQKDDVKVRTIAEAYNQKYNREIVEGTRRKHILLEDGKRRGKSVEEIECSSGFIPSVYTPILNWLYFFIIEGRNPEREYLREEQDKLHRTLIYDKNELSELESVENAPDMTTYIYGNITLEKFQTLKKLKRLSKSPNEHEAFAAYRKCIQLCKEYGIEFDKIP